MPTEAPEQISPILRRLPDGRTEMCCPRCEEWQDVLAFKNLHMEQKFADAVNAIVKCCLCKHAFSPKWLND